MFNFKKLQIMKKLFFTAIALVAFSGVSMASIVAHEMKKNATSIIEVVSSNTVSTKFKTGITVQSSYPKISVIISSGTTKVIESDFKSLDSKNVTNASLKCWAFGKYIRIKLNEVSDNQALIDQTIKALVALCNIADDLGWV
jgi:hypothetical protein